MTGLRVAVLAPISWRVPPRHYGPWEQFASLLCEGLVAKGVDVTLFASGDSVTAGRLAAVVDRGYSEDPDVDPKVVECLHIAHVFERAAEFDVIHNSFDFLPLTYSGLVDTPVLTTIHGFSSPRILPVYRQYDSTTEYVAISDADRDPSLDYLATIHHGIDTDAFSLHATAGDYLLFFGRIHPDKGTAEAIDVAAAAGMRLVIAGIVQDQRYFDEHVAPRLDGERVSFLGAVSAERAVGAPRRRTRTAAPDRFRRAVRLQRRRGDGVWHAGDRFRARLDGRADRGRRDRVPRRRRRRRQWPQSTRVAALDRAAIRARRSNGSGWGGWSTRTSPRTRRSIGSTTPRTSP